MSHIRSTSIILLIFILQGGKTNSTQVDKGNLCSSHQLKTQGGTVLVESVRMYRVECDHGYVVPLNSPNQSEIYSCHNGVLKTKMPQACVEKRFPYQKVGFQMLLAETSKTWLLCNSSRKLLELAARYNETVEKSTPVFFQHKLYIVNCSRATHPSGYVTVHAVTNKLVKSNMTSDLMLGGHAHVVLSTYNLLVKCAQELGHLTEDGVKTAILVYNSNGSIIGYHCDEHLEMQFDDGGFVCVGCGKGFWMDLKRRLCHPCGPGFYNPVETAVECLPCPVQYENAPWTADSITECFSSRRQLSAVSRFVEGVIVPVTYLIILVVVVSVLNKFSVVGIEQVALKKK